MRTDEQFTDDELDDIGTRLDSCARDIVDICKRHGLRSTFFITNIDTRGDYVRSYGFAESCIPEDAAERRRLAAHASNHLRPLLEALHAGVDAQVAHTLN